MLVSNGVDASWNTGGTIDHLHTNNDITVEVDARIGGGLYVGSTGTAPAADTITADGVITCANNTGFYCKNAAGNASSKWFQFTDDYVYYDNPEVGKAHIFRAGSGYTTVLTISETAVTATLDFLVNGNTTLGNASTDLITHTGRMIVRTTASDPQHATPGSRPAGTVGEIAYYSGKWYGCTNAATPTWEKFTSA
jgi:hypothetical protein